MSPISTSPTTLFGGAAVIGLLAGVWDYIKLYFSKIMSLVIVVYESENQELNTALSIYFHKHFKCSSFGIKLYSAKHEYIRPKQRNQIVAYEKLPEEPTIWWKGKRPIIVSGQYTLTLRFIRGTYKQDEIIFNAVTEFNNETNKPQWRDGDNFRVIKCYGSIGNKKLNNTSKSNKDSTADAASPLVEGITFHKHAIRPVGWKRDEIGQPKNTSIINTLSLTPEAETALNDAIIWRDNEYWFKERSIPWKRGFLMVGDPGTGKTAFSRALGQELNVPIFSFDLSTMTNKDFSNEWSKAMGCTPCITLFEDIDSIFKGRENISVTGIESGLTFDGFLNCLDGIENTDGVFIIITTNNSTTIDPAIGSCMVNDEISTRPGRIDRVIHFGKLTSEGRLKIAKRIMCNIPENEWYHLVVNHTNDTGAQFQERCCKLALQLFWKDNKNKGVKTL